ncbi:hypothetical protein TorRG33x02_164330 [Trema orientale]|uniref:Uncharacterized protein n=1 Tax=Trema orientale TaxID=63057 RepID=A0A2P5EQB3_TREOI|nr:hypothetical protein TorRG33x02_164330 [Trema orientale]
MAIMIRDLGTVSSKLSPYCRTKRTNEKAKYLEDCLLRERRESAMQAQRISELKLGQEEEVLSTSRVCEADELMSIMPAGSSNACSGSVVIGSSQSEDSF